MRFSGSCCAGLKTLTRALFTVTSYGSFVGAEFTGCVIEGIGQQAENWEDLPATRRNLQRGTSWTRRLGDTIRVGAGRFTSSGERALLLLLLLLYDHSWFRNRNILMPYLKVMSFSDT